MGVDSGQNADKTEEENMGRGKQIEQ